MIKNEMTLVEILQKVKNEKLKGITFIDESDKENFLSYSDLYIEAIKILKFLQDKGLKPKDELVLQTEKNIDFIKIFWACILGGIIPVPISVGYNDEHRLKLFKVLKTLNNPSLIICENIYSKLLEKYSVDINNLAENILYFSDLENITGKGEINKANLNDLAFLQFSSGSTGNAKGVMLSHKNLFYNIDGIIESAEFSNNDIQMSWMPLTHDMGLIGFHLVPLMLEINQIIMGTQLFVRRPIIWMDIVNKHRVSVTCSPNFGYKHFLKFFKDDKEWNLSSLRLIFNGAEPISYDLCKEFLSKLEKYNLLENRMFTVYGLAEASLAVTFPKVNEAMRPLYIKRESLVTESKVEYTDENDINNINFMDVGYPIKHISVRITGSDNKILEDDFVGHIQIKGNNVTKGFYNNKKATEDTILEDAWVDTGDLGFMNKGRLVITGRTKDVIFVNGQNYYSHDLERVLEELDEIDLNKIAVSSVFNYKEGKDEILVFVIYKKKVNTFFKLRSKIVRVLNKKIGINADKIIPIKQVPKTTSGKIQRFKLGKYYLDGEFDKIISEMDILLIENKKSNLREYFIEEEYIAPSSEEEIKLSEIIKKTLNIDKVGIRDNFFEIGGNSLTAVMLLATINSKFKINLQIFDVFDSLNIEELINKINDSDKSEEVLKVKKIELKEKYEVSSAQKRMFLLNEIEKGKLNYNIIFGLELNGELDLDKLNNSFKEIITRHEVIRSNFVLEDNKVYQKIINDYKFNIEIINSEEVSLKKDIDVKLKWFDLNKESLFKVFLFKLDENRSILIINTHHIIFDGYSVKILLDELFKLYNGEKLEELDIQYKDFAKWQNDFFVSDQIKNKEKYWLEEYKELPQVLNLHTDFNRKSEKDFSGKKIIKEIDLNLFAKVNKDAIENNVTVYMYLLTAYNILLNKYTGQNDIVVGAPIAGRTNPEFEKNIGMFVNTLALRNKINEEGSFEDLLKDIKNNLLKAYSNQDYQFENLIEKLNIPRDTSRNPLFDTMFVYQNMDFNIAKTDNLDVLIYEVDTKNSKFDITLTIIEKNGNINLEAEYSTELFEEQTINRFLNNYIDLLKTLSYKEFNKIKDIEIISNDDREKIKLFNDTNKEYSNKITVLDFFEKQVKNNPGNVAVIYNDEELTYKELDVKSNNIAAMLVEQGVKKNTFVGIALERSLEMIIGIFGIIKSGAAYLPIDPNYPLDRIKFIIEDSNLKVLLTQERFNENFEAYNIKSIGIDNKEIYNKFHLKNSIEVLPEDLAYMIYTSGSTGIPKGVMIQHTALVNRLEWMQERYPLFEEDVILQKTPFTFDVSVWEMFWWSMYGAKVCLLNQGVEKDPKLMIDTIKENKVSIMHFVPSMLSGFLEYLKYNSKEDKLKSLRQVFSSGEELLVHQVNLFNEKLLLSNKTKLINLYGPTEATIDVSYFDCFDKENIKRVPIGKPINNIKLYVLDKNLKQQAIGVPGELCIAGIGLSKGYLNREELNKEKFTSFNGERIYRTGDLARWLEDGNVEFLGRLDFQVKIRGNRIELGEIGFQLLKYEKIQNAFILDKVDKDGNKYLCAYYISDEIIIVRELIEFLKLTLPEYMIPSYFVKMDSFPLSQNGKLERKSLPEPEELVETGVKYVAAETEIEKELLKIWQELLNVDKISVNDNFFELGGHSLKATVLSANVYKKLGLELSIVTIFSKSTIKEQSKYLESLEKKELKKINKTEKKEYYKLSSAQKRMYLLNQFEPETINYNIPTVFKLKGNLDKLKLEECFNKLINRHKILRTKIEIINGEAVQRVIDNIEIEIDYKEIEEKKVLEEIEKSVVKFDLKSVPLLRVKVFKIKQDDSILFIDMHHIVADGISINILINDFVKIYKGEKLEELKLDYIDYSEWQNSDEIKEELKNQEIYWKKRFEGEIPVLDLLTDYKRPKLQNFEGANVFFEIFGEEYLKIKKYLKEKNITINMLLLSALNILLFKYTNQEDIVIGSPISGRTRSELKDIFGVFINTLAHRNYPSAEKTINEFIAEVKEQLLLDYSNQDYQYENLLEKLDIKRDLSRNPLFDIMISVQNFNEGFNVDLGEIQLSEYEYENKVAKLDLTLFALEKDSELKLLLNYGEKLFKKDTIERMKEHLKNIIEIIVENPEMKLKEITITTKEEEDIILNKFNMTDAEYLKDITIHQLFEKQAEKYPDNIAVVFEEEEISYKELNERANSLACLLREKGLEVEEKVLILLDKSIDMIVSILAILKAGACYLPVDPKYPEERIEFIIKDSNAKFLLTNNSIKNNFIISEKIDVENIEIYINNKNNLENFNKQNNLAYIIYTSGTTGKPKGVMINHKNVIRLMKNNKFQFDFNDKDIWTMFHSYCFDFSVWEMYGALLYGGKLVVIPETVSKSPKLFFEKLIKENVTILNQTPASFYNLIEEDRKNNTTLKIRYVIFGGEALTPLKLKEWREKYKNIKLINMYGITETTVHVTYKEIKDLDIEKNISNIGKPIPTLKTYIMDDKQNLLPIGIPGEICVGGDGVARGYLNREDLTNEKFVKNPYEINGILYKSGDLARFLSNGDLEYLGRIDHQVKIRGFRIELGEIKFNLLKHKEIKDAFILDKIDKDGNKYLCAYYISDEIIIVRELIEFLKLTLPDYMIPSYFVKMDSFPLTQNGKINRKVLPEPEELVETGVKYVAAETDMEKELLKIWQELLNVDKISMNDNFFELGGHSLKATVLSANVYKKLGLELSIVTIFSKLTIKEQAKYLESLEKKESEKIKKSIEKEYYKLSSAQKRMYLLNQFDTEAVTYNMPTLLKFTGNLDILKLEESFNKLIKRHKILRTKLDMYNGELGQKVLENIEVKIDCKEIKQEILEEEISKLIKIFDLKKLPLLRVNLFKLSQEAYILFVDMHHIISDGISQQILIKELAELYKGNDLKEIFLDYTDYSEWQNSNEVEEKLLEQEKYWIERFKGEIPLLELETDYKRSRLQNFEGENVYFEISNKEFLNIKTFLKEKNITINMFLLTALNILLYKYTGQEDIVIGSPVSGRTRAELNDIMGVFINTLAHRNYPKAEKNLEEFILEVKEQLLMDYMNQDYQYEKLLEKVDIKRDLSRNPLFDIMINVQNFNEQTNFDLGGVQLSEYEYENKIAKLDITLFAIETKTELKMLLNYGKKLFKKDTIERMKEHLKNIIKIIAEKPEMKIKEIDITNRDEKKQLIEKFNETKMLYNKEEVIPEILIKQAEKYPMNIAYEYENSSISYAELNNEVNKYSSYLKDNGVLEGEIVGVLLNRSIEMVVSILSILKLGAAYLPLDITYPTERLEYMLKDSKSKYLITTEEISKEISTEIKLILKKDLNNNKNIYSEFKKVNSENRAYVIYTSGSTGKPKGVEISHKNILNFIEAMKQHIDFKTEKKVLFLTTISFDISVLEMFVPLTTGSKIIISTEEEQLNPKNLSELIKSKEIDILQITPSRIRLLMSYDKNLECLSSVKEIVIGGESFPNEILPLLKEKRNLRIYNVYGPTETTVWSTIKELTNTEEITIGKPIGNTQLYIYDSNMNMLPIGVPGFLYIGGDGVSQGYLFEEELTREKFVKNPLNSDDIIYNTGDFAKWLSNGEIEFLGRKDNQVKIRGFRVELDEIEKLIIKNKKIKEVVVEVKKDKNDEAFLCAYYVKFEELIIAELKKELSNDLPNYMIPSRFVELEEMPLTDNGKINRALLPSPEGEIETGVEYIEAKSDIEKELLKIWQELLNVDKISMNDNFFELGGHSLSVIKLVELIKTRLGKEITVMKIFEISILKNMCEYLNDEFVEEKFSSSSKKGSRKNLLKKRKKKER